VNKDRRKVIANIFADTAKYTLTVGVIGSIVADKLTLFAGLSLGLTVLFLGCMAYFVTPKDRKEE
jgi:hypothetical protein